MFNALTRLFRFGIVGCAGIAIDFFITGLCKEILKVNKFAANVAGFILAVANNFLLNRIWTYKNNDADIFKQLSLFVLISLTGLAFNTGIVFILHEKKKMSFYLSKIMAIAVVFCWNFAANSFFTFGLH